MGVERFLNWLDITVDSLVLGTVTYIKIDYSSLEFRTQDGEDTTSMYRDGPQQGYSRSLHTKVKVASVLRQLLWILLGRNSEVHDTLYHDNDSSLWYLSIK